MKKKEKIFNIKVNKKVLEKFMAKLFWYILIFITLMAFVLWIFSMSELKNVWDMIKDSLYEAWALLRIPFITSILCVSWLGLVVLFVYMVRKS